MQKTGSHKHNANNFFYNHICSCLVSLMAFSFWWFLDECHSTGRTLSLAVFGRWGIKSVASERITLCVQLSSKAWFYAVRFLSANAKLYDVETSFHIVRRFKNRNIKHQGKTPHNPRVVSKNVFILRWHLCLFAKTPLKEKFTLNNLHN